MKISKELISEVLKDKLYLLIDENFTYSILDNYVLFAEDECVIFEINIYEFVFKSKKWAENKGYIIFSKNKECLVYSIDEVYDIIECLNQYEDYFEANTEIEAIIKACNWVLEKEIQEENRLQLQEDLTEYNKLIKEGL